ncbi:MAG: tyrosine-type recombinase/integrase [Gammaproteobacteria bacterium]|jgi:integrase|nr:tyrosine-type recombinase/integrase [Gammaproteobacteria bacterium]
MPKKRRQDKDGLYRRPNSPYWWATYIDASKCRVRCSTGTTERSEAAALLAKWKLEARQQRQWDQPPERTFEDLMVAYLKASKGVKRSSETDRYRLPALRRHFAGCIMQEVTATKISDYVTARRIEGVSDSTINRELALLSAAITCVNRDLDWRLPNPIAKRWLAEPEGRIRWITKKEAKALIAAAQEARRAPFLADLISVALHTGCRRGELLGLEWNRVDLRNNLIYLEARHTKAKKRRALPLGSRTREALLRRARFRAEHCPASPWVFAYRDGHPAYDIRGAFNKACRDAGITELTFHDLRHTCAAWLVQAGIPLATIRDLLGHSTVLMTERYAHLAPDNLRVVVDTLDESHSSHTEQEDQQDDALRSL